MPPTIPDSGKKFAAAVYFAYGLGWKARLFKSALTPGDATVLADIDECDFDGYAPASLSYVAHGLDVVAHKGYIRFGAVTWTKAAGATGNLVYGWALTATDPDDGFTEVLVMIGLYSPELGMFVTGDEIPLQIEHRFRV